MSARIDVQFGCDVRDVVSESDVRAWAAAVLDTQQGAPELTIRLVGEEEGTALNETYRRGRGPTNVLSFEFDPPPGVASALLGDVVICAPVIEREAREQGKSIRAHWAHMVVHGTLHLLGYDHHNEEQAGRMESLECLILQRLGFENPYETITS